MNKETRLEKTIKRFKVCATLFLLTAFNSALFAQTAANEIETLLQTPAVTYAQAARFVLEASDAFATPNHENAFNYAMQRGWLPKKATATQSARLDAVSLLCMKSFDIKGGLFYSMTNNAHYAYRELSYRNVVHGRVDPTMDVSGDLLLYMVNRILGERDIQRAIEEGRERTKTKSQKAVEVRREELVAEITTILEEQKVADTTVEATSQGVKITLSNIQFLADSSLLPNLERAKLQEIANILKNIPNIKLLIAGHTALAGTEDARYNLSLERAQAVASFLVSLGACSASNIIAEGYGAERPVADNTTPAGMAANRRVEILILEN